MNCSLPLFLPTEETPAQLTHFWFRAVQAPSYEKSQIQPGVSDDKAQQLTLRGFLFAFNHDIARTFLFLWASEIWEKHNLLLRSSDNCSLSWLVVQPFVSLQHSLSPTLPPPMLLFSHCFVFPCKKAIDKSSKENLIVVKTKKTEKRNSPPSFNLQS